MTIALNEARAIGEERILARTDELTGLPNRRKLIGSLQFLQIKMAHYFYSISMASNR